MVLLDVVVTDGNGNPVTGLTEDDFRVFEDDKSQKVASFKEHKGAPIVQDKRPPLDAEKHVHELPGGRNRRLHQCDPDGLAEYARSVDVDYVAPAGPQVPQDNSAGSTGGHFHLSSRLRMVQDFTTDSSKLLAVLNSLGTPQHSQLMQSDAELQSNQAESTNVTPTGNDMVDAAMDPRGLLAEESVGLTVERVETTLTAFQQLTNYLAGFPGRKNVMWVSGSFPIVLFPDASLPTPSRGQHAFMNDLEKTADLCTAAQIAIYPIAAEGLMTDPYFAANAHALSTVTTSPNPGQFSTRMYSRQNSMELLAKSTGGQAFYNTNGIKDVLDHVTNEGMHYYTLSYTPTNTKMDNRYRQTRVELAEAKYKLSYRRGYYATDTEIGAGVTNTRNPLLPLMNLGLPDMAQLVYNLSVNPLTARGSARPGKMLTDFKGPMTHYASGFRCLALPGKA